MLFRSNELVVFLGDSITCRTGVIQNPDLAKRFKLDYVGSYAEILMKKLMIHFPELQLHCHNKGVGGNTVIDLLDRLHEDVISLRPDWVILLIGHNDRAKFTLEEFRDNLDSLLDILRASSIQVLLLSTLANPDANLNTSLREFDLTISEMAAKYRQRYIDIKAPFEQVMDYNKKAEAKINLFIDGTHLTELGNMLLADTVYDAITSGV